MKVSDGRVVGVLEHLFLAIRQAILEIWAGPVALGAPDLILGALKAAHPAAAAVLVQSGLCPLFHASDMANPPDFERC